jgi:hypothetical protein
MRMTKSAGSKTCPLTKSNIERSTFGRSGSMFLLNHAREPVVEREQSVESPTLSGRRQDLSPCSTALGWPRVR